eukprot:m51a1_g9884 hypothetical protein (353) ;mRNA; r:19173-20446
MEIDLGRVSVATAVEVLMCNGFALAATELEQAVDLLRIHVKDHGLRDILSGSHVTALRSMAVAISVPKSTATRAALVHSITQALCCEPYERPCWLPIAAALGVEAPALPGVVTRLGVVSLLASGDRPLVQRFCQEVGVQVVGSPAKTEMLEALTAGNAMVVAAQQQQQPQVQALALAREAREQRRPRGRRVQAQAAAQRPELAAGVSVEQVEEAYTVAELRAWAVQRGVAKYGNKTELATRVVDFLEGRPTKKPRRTHSPDTQQQQQQQPGLSQAQSPQPSAEAEAGAPMALVSTASAASAASNGAVPVAQAGQGLQTRAPEEAVAAPDIATPTPQVKGTLSFIVRDQAIEP